MSQGREGCLLFSLIRPGAGCQQPLLAEFQAPDRGLGRARGERLGSGLRPRCQQSSAQHPQIRRGTGIQGSSSFSSLTAGREHLLPPLPAQLSIPWDPGRRGGVLPGSPRFQPQLSEAHRQQQRLACTKASTQALRYPEPPSDRARVRWQPGSPPPPPQPPGPPQRMRTAPQPAPVPPHRPSIAGSLRCARQIQSYFPSAQSCEHQVKSLKPRARQPSRDLNPTVPRAAAIETALPFPPPPSFTRGQTTAPGDSTTLCKRLEGTRCPHRPRAQLP